MLYVSNTCQKTHALFSLFSAGFPTRPAAHLAAAMAPATPLPSAPAVGAPMAGPAPAGSASAAHVTLDSLSWSPVPKACFQANWVGHAT